MRLVAPERDAILGAEVADSVAHPGEEIGIVRRKLGYTRKAIGKPVKCEA
jgi:hypothetical protein